MHGRPLLLAISLLAAGIAAPAHSHLSGVFAYFVRDINEPTASTRLLRQQLRLAQERIAALTPEVDAARAAFDARADASVRRVRFYDIYAGSALGALWAGAQNPMDVLASTALMRRRLEQDLDALAELAESYEQLGGMERSLRRYAELLIPFRDAAEARDQRLADVPAGLVSPFAEPYIAYRIAEDWETLRGSTFVLYFHWAARRLADQGLADVLTDVDRDGSAWHLEEEVLNALVGGDGFPFIDDARFYLRADHVNFAARMHSARDSYHLLTVGQLERTGPASVQYRIEAIFVDGMPIDPSDPDVQREVYQGELLRIDLAALLPDGADTVAFEQRNGSVRFALP